MLTPPLSSIRPLQRLSLLALVLMAASANLYAQQPMPITLTGSAEVPPVATSATGTVQITVLSDRTVSGSVKTSGFDPTMAHIHEAAIGKNGPPIITLTKATNDSFIVPSTSKLTEAQYKSYLGGNLYVNVHSTANPNGELRAQLPRPEAPDMPPRANY
jgi:hypothetical protein